MNNEEKQRKYLDYFHTEGLIIELGSGRGDFLRVCKNAGVKAEGVDADRNSISVKEFKAKVADVRVFLRKQKPAIYGSIYARHVIEHFFPEELEKLMKSVYRALKKEGRFIVIFPNLGNINVAMCEFWKDETHARPYPGETVIKMLKETGFKIVKSGPDNDSWDNLFLKNIVRFVRGVITGIHSEPPDYFIVAEK